MIVWPVRDRSQQFLFAFSRWWLVAVLIFCGIGLVLGSDDERSNPTFFKSGFDVTVGRFSAPRLSDLHHPHPGVLSLCPVSRV